jgi:nucleoside phosphorylase
LGHVIRVGALVGLPFEAAILEKRLAGAAVRLSVRCSGADPATAARAAAELARSGAELLLSFGLAGALDPAIRPGELLIPETVVDAAGASYATDPVERTRFAARLAEPCRRPRALLGVAAVVPSPAEKARLFAATGAAAIDMESLPLAAAAASADRPLLVVRAVADPAERAIPRAALAGIDAAGKIRLDGLAAALLGRPGDLVGLLQLAADSARAKAKLGRAARALARSLVR